MGLNIRDSDLVVRPNCVLKVDLSTVLVNCQRERPLGKWLTIGPVSLDLDRDPEEYPLGAAHPLPSYGRIAVHLCLKNAIY